MAKFRNVLMALYLMSSVYAFGGGVMQGVMNYPAWHLVGADEFPAFHRSVGGRVQMLFVPVFFLSVALGLAMAWLGHPAVSRRLLVVAALVNAEIFIATGALAIPIQIQLAGGKSAELIDRLIFYDRYLRTLPGCVVMVLTFAMLWQVLSKAESGGPV